MPKFKSLVEASTAVANRISELFEDAMVITASAVPYVVAGKILDQVQVSAPQVYSIVTSALDMAWMVLVLRWLADDFISMTETITSITPFLTGLNVFLILPLLATLYLIIYFELRIYKVLV